MHTFVTEYRQAAAALAPKLAALETISPARGGLAADTKSELARLAQLLRNAGLFLDFPRLATVAQLLGELGHAPTLTPDQAKLVLAGLDVAAQLVRGIEAQLAEPPLADELAALAAAARRQGLAWEPTGAAAPQPAAELSEAEKIAELLGDAPAAPATPVAAPKIAAGAEMIAIFVQDAEEILDHTEQDLLHLEQEPARLHELLRHIHTLKGNSGLMGFDGLQQISHRLENVLQQIRDGAAQPTPARVKFFLEVVDAMRRRVALLAQGGAANPDADALWLARIDAMLHAPGTVTEAVAGAVPEPVATATPAGRGGVRVSVERLDHLNDLSGELVIATAVANHLSACRPGGDIEQFNRAFHQLNLITSEMQDIIMVTRMVPIEVACRRLTRLVRELSEKTGKPLELQLVGVETEVDRRVIELLADPLVHMVRNAVDHGIEPPAARRQTGKPAVGTIRVAARHHSGEVWISISDDGQGLPREKILTQARGRGRFGPTDEPRDEDLFAVVFEPGFSTAETVTEVSGRGVGLDVVRRNVERLRGRIEVQSRPQLGATLTIKLPLTLAVIQGMLVRAGAEQYVLPILAIRESLRVATAEIHQVMGRGEMLVVRGETIPLFRLADLLQIEQPAGQPAMELVTVIEDGDRRVALLLDELLGQQRLVVKSLGDALGRIPGVAGASILADGRVRLILDVPGLIRLAHERMT